MEATYSETSMAFDEPQQGQRNQGDDTLFVRFMLFPHKNPTRSIEEGRPIYEDREYLEITIPGDNGSTVHRPVRPGDSERFPRHYAAFKARTSQDALDGTPLGVWPAIARAQVEELSFFKIKTIEQLANVSDVVCQKMAGLSTLKGRAKAFLDATKDSAFAEKVTAQIAAKDTELEVMRNQLDAMQKQLTELTAKKK